MPRRVSFSEPTKPQSEQMNGPTKATSIKTTAPKCRVTIQRPPATSISTIDNPGLPRGNAAISADKPHGDADWLKRYGEYTPLQQHILFWDRDHDGQIYPWDTYRGFRELGFNILFSILAMLIINLNFSYPTRLAHSFIPDPFFRVYVDSIYKAKHGSDSGTYDSEGRFVPQSFENLFAMYDRDGDGALTFWEVGRLMHGHRCAVDPFGWFAALFEWGTTWLLIQREGRIEKEDLRGVYDGSLFWKVREERLSGSGWKQGFGLGGDGFIGPVKVF
ncbi:caleosin family protein [Aspergillus homomorphus CBS 101889]|uniref:Caleosin-domain-containing protein n=1 Tax=Aspergillus homomorphus (strain CBS 101889) TaxID=1450537 RepID=A0A395HWK6_ASPHC|nr:Caleosin-domain-containing protein [Aspergillus homomorphus CBS 101889]RAL11228.1 Caleosin-domain-containing protein [Aspergillus homomorphus CBS 101889]